MRRIESKPAASSPPGLAEGLSSAQAGSAIDETGTPADSFAADWRVLLPLPPGGTYERLLLLGGAPSLDELLVRMGLARQVLGQTPSDPIVDAVALLAGAGVSPSDIAGCMRREGVLYWEVDQRSHPNLHNRPDRIGEHLRNCGFTDVAVYRVRADFQNCNSYLPLQARGAVEWFFHEKLRRPSLLRRLALRLRHTHVSACHAAVAVRKGAKEAGASSAILGQLPESAARSATHVIVVKRRGRRERHRRLIVFGFPNGAREPVNVLKVSRSLEQAQRIEAEQSSLALIRELVADEMRSTLPEPLGVFRSGTSLIGVETYMAGELRERSHVGRSRQFDLGISWIIAFNRQAEVSRNPWRLAEVERWVDTPIAEYRERFGAGESELRLFEALRTRARLLDGERLPLVWRHGDLNESNVSFAHESLRVVDWESATIGLPLFDLLTFSTSWALRTEERRDPNERLRRLHEILVDRATDSISTSIWRAVDGYMAALGIDRRFLPILVALNWIYSGPPDSSRNLVVRSLADGCDRLFAGTNS
jgi:hypothetical protein